jgi:hypothetical protein
LRFSWRAAELVIPKRRLDLAHQLRRLVHDADARLLPGAQAFDRLAVRAEAENFLALADRLADLERPVAPRGVLLLEQLLDDPWSPLNDRDREDEVRGCLAEAAEALEH